MQLPNIRLYNTHITTVAIRHIHARHVTDIKPQSTHCRTSFTDKLLPWVTIIQDHSFNSKSITDLKMMALNRQRNLISKLIWKNS